MPTENRLPVARQAFQPSRSRLLQPSELFRKSHPDVSEQAKPAQNVDPQPSHLPSKSTDSKTQVPLRAQNQPNPQSRYQYQPNNKNDANPAHSESQPIPRIPRISKSSASLSKQNPAFARTATPFVLKTSPNTQRVTPLLSRSQVKSHSFPLRSPNQPPLKSPNQPSLLKSRNQTSLPVISRSAQPQHANHTLTTTTQTPSRQSLEPHVVKTSKPSAPSASVAPVSPGGNVTESRHSQESIITSQNTATTPGTADVSVPQPTVPFPLSTLPPHVLLAMSKGERDGFIAGWSAGWAACMQSMHSKHNDTTTLVRSPMSGNIATIQQNLSPVEKEHFSPSARLPPNRVTLSEGEPKTNPPVMVGASPRRRLSVPYENGGPSRDSDTVGANKRPRTSHPAHPKINSSSATKGDFVEQATSGTRVTNTSSTSIPAMPSRQTPHVQHPHPESRKRSTGQDAYLARGNLKDMRSVDDAFAAATTQDPVEFHRKKRKRIETVNAADSRRPTERKLSRDPRRQAQIASQSNPARGVEIRNKPSIPQSAQAGSRKDPRKPSSTLRDDTNKKQQGRSLSSPRQPVQVSSAQDPVGSSETRRQQNSEQHEEIRYGQRSGNIASNAVCQQPRWLADQSPPRGRLRLPNLHAGNLAFRQVENGDGVVRVVPTHRVKPTSDQRQRQSTGSVNCPAVSTDKATQPSVSANGLPMQLGHAGGMKQRLPNQATNNTATRDMDMQAPDSQEESGWGTALDAVTSRERLPSVSKGSSERKEAAPVCNTNGTSQKLPQVPNRDPRQKKRSGINLGTAEKSAASRQAEKERDDITVQAYAERFGLVIVERNHESGKVEWVACKFCPVFGCRTRDPDYIMAHRAPFYAKKFVAHLEKDHCVKWKEYSQSNAKEKVQLFSGKVLPAKAFRDRVAELKRTQDGIARRPVAPVITTEAENALIDKALEKLTKSRTPSKPPTIILDTTDECWIGRNMSRDGSSTKISVSQIQKPTVAVERLPRLQRISECIKELEIHSDIAGLILNGVLKNSDGDVDEECVNRDSGFTDTIVIDGDEMRPTTILFANVDKAKALRVALAMRYLYYGISGSACMTLWQDAPEVRMDSRYIVDSSREVFGHGNAIMGLGMHIVSRALIQNWAMGLKTRSCRYVSGKAVEVLVSVRDDCGAVRRVHLVTVLDVNGAGKAVVEVLEAIFPCWRERLIGLHSGICKETEVEEKRVEGAILEEVRNFCERELLVVEHEGCVEEKPMFPWVLSKLCESKFNSLLSSIGVPLGLALGKARLEAAKAQRKELFSRVMRGGNEQELFDESWKVAGERAAEIHVVAEGLQTIWMCDCEGEERVKSGQQRGQGNVIDCDAERVLWTRGVVDMWKWCKTVVRDLGMESPL